MEPEENVMYTGFKGTREFTVVNSCSTAISHVRITHFLKDTGETTEYFIQENMDKNATASVKFTSVESKEDNWNVAFQRAGKGYMCGKLTCSMKQDRSNYRLVITETDFAFRYDEGKKPKKETKDVKTVYGVIG